MKKFQHYFRFLELVKVRGDVEENAVFSPRESDASEKQDEEHEVRVRGREIDHLRRIKHYHLDVQPTIQYFHWDLFSVVQKPGLHCKLIKLCSIGKVHHGFGTLGSSYMPVASKSNYLLATRIN